MNLRTTSWTVALLVAGAASCSKNQPPTTPTSPPPRPPADGAPPPAPAADAPSPTGFDAAAALRDPSKATLRAPDAFSVKLETSKGPVVIDVERAWAPMGADRFYNLVKAGYYDGVAFFRVIAGFMAQVGISSDPALNAVWREARIPDDPVRQSNKTGYVTYAMGGPNTRTTQFFINFVDNLRLDSMGFAPFGRVREESMAVVNQLYSGYGEGAPSGRGPNQGRIQLEGRAYLEKEFPELDHIERATIME